GWSSAINMLIDIVWIKARKKRAVRTRVAVIKRRRCNSVLGIRLWSSSCAQTPRFSGAVVMPRPMANGCDRSGSASCHCYVAMTVGGPGHDKVLQNQLVYSNPDGGSTPVRCNP